MDIFIFILEMPIDAKALLHLAKDGKNALF